MAAATARELALRLAKHIGVVSFDPDDESNTSPLHLPGLRRGDVRELAACLNTALYEIWGRIGRSGGEEQLVLRAPYEVELELNEGEREIVRFDGFAPWMKGCRVVIAGQLNRIVDEGELEEPYTGVVAVVEATVWHDVVPLDATLAAVLGEMRGLDAPLVVKAMEEEAAFHAVVQEGVEAGDWGGVPACFYVKERGERLEVAFFPAPETGLVLAFDVQRRMIEVRPEDIEADEDGQVPLRALEQMGLPPGWALEVVYPLALQRLWLHPDFESRLAKDEVARQAEQARATLRSEAVRREVKRGGRGETQLIPAFR